MRLVRRLKPFTAFGASLALYLLVAALLAFRYDSFNLDAVSREANAYYMFFSRDPHLAAIGFVWNPLPSFLDIPLILLKIIWEPLATRAFAAYVMAAVFMAGSVAMMASCLTELGVRGVSRSAITCLYALHPMIVYYGGNGMSEGIFLFTLMLACRYLIRWINAPDVKSLILAGSAIGVAYLARNEAAVPAAVGCAAVGAITFFRSHKTGAQRVTLALTDMVIYGAPFLISFVGWAVTSWIIVGSPFEQFSSIYGTASQLRSMRAAGTLSTHGDLQFVAKQLVTLEPAMAIIGLLAVLAALWRRDFRIIAPVAIFGGVLSFAVAASLGGQTAGFYRYFITEVPLGCLAAGICAKSVLDIKRESSGVGHIAHASFIVVAALVLLGPGLPVSGAAMLNERIGTEEATNLGYIVHGTSDGDAMRWRTVHNVAQQIDGMRLRNGTILVDNFTECVPELIMNSKTPQQFVIPNDRDYERVLADPATFHASYFLVPPASGGGTINAVNRAYPEMYANGSGIAELVREFTPAGCDRWRLYRLKSAVPVPSGTPSPAPRGNS